MKFVINVLILLASLGVASAQEFTGATLINLCDAPKDSVTATSICKAYVSGFLEGLRLGNLLPEAGHGFCPPKTLTAGQGLEVFQAFVKTRPNLLGESASAGMMAAMVLTYPCNRTQTK